MDKGIVTQYYATILPNVGITHVLRIIFMQANKKYIAKNEGGCIK